MTKRKVKYTDDDILTTKEVTTYLNVSPVAISKWRQKGFDMKCARVGNKCFYYFRDVKEFIEMMTRLREDKKSYRRKKGVDGLQAEC
jgi:hypothetical protein